MGATREDIAKLLLRLSTGGLMLFHGYEKISNGIARIYSMLSAAGLPGFIAPGVYIGEVVVPIFIILGVFTRSAALLLAANMIFTIHLAFRDKIFTLNAFGGWTIELNVFFLVTAVCIALLGSGKYAVRK